MAFTQQQLAGLSGQQHYGAAVTQQGAPLILPPVSGAGAINPYALLQQGGT